MQNTGIEYLIAGFSLLTKPGLKRFVILPVLINLLLFFMIFFVTFHYFDLLNQWVTGLLPTWLQWLNHVVWVIFFISFFLLIIYTFVTLANLIAAPFNSLLAEKVELYLTQKKLPEMTFWNNIKDISRVFTRQFAIIIYFLPRAIVLSLLFFIPLVQLIAPFIWLLFHAWLMTLQYIDYPTDNHKIPFSKVRSALVQKKWLSLSFGMSVLVFSMIPILNWIVMPAAVAGGTKLWLEQFKQN